MLIIGHRGSKGTTPENTIESLREAIRVDADMIELDIRLSRDNVPVLVHNLLIHGSRKRDLSFIRRNTLTELRKRTVDTEYPIVTLDEAMRECFDKIFLNIEIKEMSGVAPTLEVISKYAKTKKSWDSLLVSSYNPLALSLVRRRVPHAALSLLHYRNSLKFVGWHRILNLSGVGFHRLYVNDIALEVAKKFGLFTYAYTVNRPEAMAHLENRGVDAVVTDYPEKMLSYVKR